MAEPFVETVTIKLSEYEELRTVKKAFYEKGTIYCHSYSANCFSSSVVTMSESEAIKVISEMLLDASNKLKERNLLLSEVRDGKKCTKDIPAVIY